MMSTDTIPDSVRRFVLTSIPTVPHLEALLLLWREAMRDWSVSEIAGRLYVSELAAAALLDDLYSAGLVSAGEQPMSYRSKRDPHALVQLLDDLDATYSAQLRAVTALIHSNVDRKGARFAQAFAWRKE